MKTKLFYCCMAIFMALGLVGCNDEEHSIDIESAIVGKWKVLEPEYPDGFFDLYTFNADRTGSIYHGSPTSNGIPVSFNYTLTGTSEGEWELRINGECYLVSEISSDKMKWDTYSTCSHLAKKLEKVK